MWKFLLLLLCLSFSSEALAQGRGDTHWVFRGFGSSAPAACAPFQYYIISTDGSYRYCIGGVFVNPFTGGGGGGISSLNGLTPATQTFASANDTNVTLSIGSVTATHTFTLGWTGTLAAGRLNSNVVQSAVNDTNVTGSISAQALTLGWTGTLSVARGGSGAGTFATHGVLLGQGTGAFQVVSPTADAVVLWQSATADPVATSVPDCQDSVGNHLNYTASTHLFSCGTSSSGGNTAFSAITAGTNANHLTMGTGGTLDTSGTAVINFGTGGHTTPALVGATASKPATCTVGEMYFANDATAGQNWFYCTATNTWTQQLNSGGGSYTGFGSIYPITDPTGVTFSWRNQGGASVTSGTRSIYLLAPAAAGDNIRGREISAPSVPFSIIAAIVPQTANQNFPSAGLYVTDGTKLEGFAFGTPSNSNILNVSKYNSVTSFNGTAASPGYGFAANPTYLKVLVDSTNLTFYWSVDGVNFIQAFQEAKTTFLGTITAVGYYVNSNNATWPAAALLVSWLQGTS